MCFIYVFIVRHLQLHREGLQLHKEGMQLHRDKTQKKQSQVSVSEIYVFWGARKFKCLVLISANLSQLMFLLWHLHFLLVDNSCENVRGEFLIFFLMNSSKDLDGILKTLWWVFEDLPKKTYGNTLALFISSWSSFVAASIQEFAIKFWRILGELYQNWLYIFDALLMHFWILLMHL